LGIEVIVSHEHKFIFLKTRKTAGTSLELAFRQLCGPDDIITTLPKEEALAAKTGARGAQNWHVHSWWHSLRPLHKRRWLRQSPKDYGFHSHMSAKDARTLIKDEKTWRTYFKFAFERNPWDRQVSLYHFRIRHGARLPSFVDHIHHDKRARIKNFEIYSIDGEVCIDYLGRYESLEQDFRKVLNEVGLTYDQPLPHANAHSAPQQGHYRDFYDDATREIVRKWYMPEINLVGYEF
jgi:Sulfotransferase family